MNLYTVYKLFLALYKIIFGLSATYINNNEEYITKSDSNSQYSNKQHSSLETITPFPCPTLPLLLQMPSFFPYVPLTPSPSTCSTSHSPYLSLSITVSPFCSHSHPQPSQIPCRSSLSETGCSGGDESAAKLVQPPDIFRALKHSCQQQPVGSHAEEMNMPD